MYKKSRRENDLRVMFPENQELITRKKSITGPRSLVPLCVFSYYLFISFENIIFYFRRNGAPF